jgi:pimeloyl-ACP methyl ester carboxylesterase
MKKAFLILLCCILFASACSDSKEETSTTNPGISSRKITFTPCGPNQCGKFSVPMDYSKPNGRKISLAVLKIPAAIPSQRVGALLVNPGGPGASGVDFVRDNAQYIFSQDVLNHFDIIGWDPRGVGQSTNVQCSSSLDKLFDVDYTPDDDTEIKALDDANKWIGQQCKKDDAQLLPHLDSIDSAKDMDSIRVGLGEKQINYLGFSYGTVLGQMYATMYPKNFRTMVIDGVVDIGMDPTKLAVEQTVGFESSLDSFFEYCKENGCQFAGSQDPKTAFEALTAQVDQTPIASHAHPDFMLGPAQLDIGSSYFLYSGQTGWKALDSALASTKAGNPDAMLTGFSQYVGRADDGTYDGSYASYLAIGCADGKIGSQKEMLNLARDTKEKAPIYGVSGILLGLPCATWPNVDNAKSYKVDAKGSAPIVVIGSTGDPATPASWARSAAKELKTGIYIERRGEGHTAYGQGDSCIDDLVNNYFVDKDIPNSKVCN